MLESFNPEQVLWLFLCVCVFVFNCLASLKSTAQFCAISVRSGWSDVSAGWPLGYAIFGRNLTETALCPSQPTLSACTCCQFILFRELCEWCMGILCNFVCLGFPDGAMVKNPPVNAGDAGDTGSVSGREKIPCRRK